jgi:hypothetical protein
MPSLTHPHLAICLWCVALTLCGHASALERSKGVYRIPYADGTSIRIGNDHLTHKPIGRIDMNGTGGGSYRIVAAADGIVRYVVDGFEQRLDCKKDDGSYIPISQQKNNFVWIEHANGEWTKYTHMTKGSASSKARLKVGQSVKAGTYLGDEGDVGCASGKHLHFEVGVPRASDPLTSTGGFLADNEGSKRNRIPRICGIDGGIFVENRSYTARKVPGAIPPGAKEVARHGVPAQDYQCLFDQAVNAGYALEWIDGFDVDGKVYYNAIFRPTNGTWAAFHGLTGTQYQQRFNEYVGKGYRPYQVESYGSGNGTRYAVIYRKQSGPAFKAYHGLSTAEHQQRMDSWTANGYRPRNVSVASAGGQRRYTALYEKVDIGSWQAKSQLTPAEYQQAFDANRQQGRQVVYLNGYVHGGQAYLTAIWSSKPTAAFKARHGLSSSQYQTEWESATGSGLLTRYVSGYSGGGSARYAAVWRK